MKRNKRPAPMWPGLSIHASDYDQLREVGDIVEEDFADIGDPHLYRYRVVGHVRTLLGVYDVLEPIERVFVGLDYLPDGSTQLPTNPMSLAMTNDIAATYREFSSLFRRCFRGHGFDLTNPLASYLLEFTGEDLIALRSLFTKLEDNMPEPEESAQPEDCDRC